MWLLTWTLWAIQKKATLTSDFDLKTASIIEIDRTMNSDKYSLFFFLGNRQSTGTRWASWFSNESKEKSYACYFSNTSCLFSWIYSLFHVQFRFCNGRFRRVVNHWRRVFSKVLKSRYIHYNATNSRWRISSSMVQLPYSERYATNI